MLTGLPFCWVCTVNAPALWDEVDAPSKDVGRLMEPFRIDCGVEALDMAPPHLFVGVGLVSVAKANANYVVRPKGLLDGPCDGGLRLALWEIIGNEVCANSKFQWVSGALQSCVMLTWSLSLL